MAEFVNLIRVLIAERQSDEEIRILALEIYEDGFALRFALPSGLGPTPKTAEEVAINSHGLMSLTLRDDIGTTYERAGRIAGPEGGIDYYTPAIPDAASFLEVFTRGGVVRFDLQGAVV
jgi:hypothetical protein